MSADNGVYTLVTAAKDGGKEYRVACASAIDNIFVFAQCGCVDDEHEVGCPGDRFDLTYVREIFGQSPVFTNPMTAAAYAQKIEDSIAEFGGTEYGLVTLNQSHVPFPGILLLVS